MCTNYELPEKVKVLVSFYGLVVQFSTFPMVTCTMLPNQEQTTQANTPDWEEMEEMTRGKDAEVISSVSVIFKRFRDQGKVENERT